MFVTIFILFRVKLLSLWYLNNIIQRTDTKSRW